VNNGSKNGIEKYNFFGIFFNLIDLIGDNYIMPHDAFKKEEILPQDEACRYLWAKEIIRLCLLSP